MTEHPADTPVPPYVSFGTLLNQLQRMEREGTPARVDPQYLSGMAGGTRSQFMVCLRSLGLIDENSHTTPTLARLASSPDQRPELLAEILRTRFPSLAALNGNATRGQLDEVMASYGLANSDTRRKAMSFYLAAATYAGIPLSPHLRPAKGIPSSGTASRRPAKKRTPKVSRNLGIPHSAPGDSADMRRAYFDLLIEKAKQGDDPSLLDRIERLVGISGETADQDGSDEAGSQ